MDGEQPDDINSPENLVLLCATCHKLIDDRPDDYPRTVVESFKQQHEERIRHVTGLGPDVQTTVVQLKARIAGSAVDIPAPHIYEAVSPRYPVDKRGYVIDLSVWRRKPGRIL
jgi:HNH endonuclease